MIGIHCAAMQMARTLRNIAYHAADFSQEPDDPADSMERLNDGIGAEEQAIIDALYHGLGPTEVKDARAHWSRLRLARCILTGT